ncbi:MAG: zinc ribbon domain-containing protein [Vicinamibacterales bacterium]
MAVSLMLPDLERLITLQEIETRAATAARTIAEAPARIAALDALLHSATDALEAARYAVADNQAARRLIEKDLAIVQQRQSKYKDQLMEVKTNHEYHAMQHQIAAAAEEVGHHEEKILVKMLKADDLQAALKRAEAALKAAQTKVQSERAAIEQEATTQTAAAAECTTARARIIAEMDDQGMVATFERIAKVRGVAVARAEDERCTVCRVRLRPAVFASVRRNDSVVQCDSCQRILYYVPPAATAQAADSAPPASQPA